MKNNLFTFRKLAAGIGVAGLLLAGIVWAAHLESLFELDENAILDGSSDDWVVIYCDEVDPTRVGVCSTVAASSALVSSFFFDPVDGDGTPSDDDVFAGAKDTTDIANDPPGDWQWKLEKATAKGDIEHAYAALYQDGPGGDFYLYFGADKLDNSGDAALGFWFLQNNVTQLGDGVQTDDPCVPSGCPFSDGHAVGDILVQADFTNGGNLGRLQAYVWDDGVDNFGLLETDAVAPAQGELERITDSSIIQIDAGGDPVVDCDDVTSTDVLCAQVNTQDETAPWDYLFKGPGGTAPSTVFPTATFFEAGVNLSTLFPGGIPCFSSFAGETRVSQSETAELDDKVFGGFDVCSVFITKTGPLLAKASDPVSYTITITNDGALPLDKGSIVDDVLGDLTDGTNPLITSSDCGDTLNPGDTCAITVDYTVGTNDPDPLKNTVTATYLRDTATVDTTVTGSAMHTVDLFDPAISFDKKAEGSDGPLDVLQGATVDYTLTLSNDSSNDTPALECTITDAMLEVSESVTLAFGDSHTVIVSKMFPDPGTFKNTATAVCSPKGVPNELEAPDSVTVTVAPTDASAAIVKTGDAFSKEGDPVDYTITITNIGLIEWILTGVTDDVLGDLLDTATPNPYRTGGTCVNDLVVDPGGECTITATRTTLADDPDPLENIVVATISDGGTGGGTVADDHTVDLVAPSYTVTKSCVEEPVTVGEYANFQIDIVNTGDVSLEIDISDLVLGIDETVLLGTSGTPCGDADFNNGIGIAGDAADGCLRIEEGVLVTEPGDVSNTVNVSATLPPPLCADPLNGPCVLPNVIDDFAGDTCTVEVDGATRTWGFWKTHGSDGSLFDSPVEFGFTCWIFENELGGSVNLGWKGVTSCEGVFEIFWASKAKESDGSKRGQLCQLQLQASRQLLAAILNTGLDNPSPVPTDSVTGKSIIEAMQDALADGDRKEIRRLMGDLAAYNESGDAVMIEAGAEIPHADPRGTRTYDPSLDGFMSADCPNGNG